MGPCTANARRPTVDSRCRGTTISCYVADLRLCGIRVWCFTENGADGVSTFVLCLCAARRLYLSSGGQGGRGSNAYRAMLQMRGTSHGPVSVCLTVCLSQVGVLLKQLKVGLCTKTTHTIAHGL